MADVRLRGSYQRAVRAANIVELFTGIGTNLFDAPGDPCGAAARDPQASDAECIATGVPAGLVGAASLDSPAAQYTFLQGGNPALTPEKSDTYSYGIVFQPRWVPGLAVTVDYFDIQIDNVISTFGANNTWTACYAQQRPGGLRAHLPQPGHRPVVEMAAATCRTSTSTSVRSRRPAMTSTSGTRVSRSAASAASSFNMTGTYLLDLITQPAPGIDLDPSPDVTREWYDCVGFYSTVCGIPDPQWRHRFRTSWQTPWDVDVSFTWRYYGGVTGLAGPNKTMPEQPARPRAAGRGLLRPGRELGDHGESRVTLGINNVLDDTPTISGAVGTTGNGNTFPQTYDAHRALRLPAGDRGVLGRPRSTGT